MSQFREIDAIKCELKPASDMPIWYVATCMTSNELAAQDALQRYGHDVWFPQIELWRVDKFAKRRIHMQRALFPGYLFISPNRNAERGVTDCGRWVKWMNQSAQSSTISSGVIQLLSKQQQSGQFIDWRNAPDRAIRHHDVGSSVMIETAPFEGLSGIVSKTAGDRIFVLINLMGRQTPIEINSDQAKTIGVAA